MTKRKTMFNINCGGDSLSKEISIASFANTSIYFGYIFSTNNSFMIYYLSKKIPPPNRYKIMCTLALGNENICKSTDSVKKFELFLVSFELWIGILNNKQSIQTFIIYDPLNKPSKELEGSYNYNTPRISLVSQPPQCKVGKAQLK